MGEQLDIRQLDRPELDELIGWAADEGWDPGRADADAFWNADPEAFVGFDFGGGLGGAGAVVAYGDELGFVGLFIVRPELRRRGLGTQLWAEMMRRLRSRLRDGAPLALDGVPEMTSFYSAGGFDELHGTSRRRAVIDAAALDPDPELVPVTQVPFEELLAFDAPCFGAPRPRFLEGWLEPEGGAGLALPGDGGLRGYGVLRPTVGGFKVGPLFAEDAAVAARLLDGLLAAAAGSAVSLDVPETNAEAVAMADAHGMKEVFRCVRMYSGRPPATAWARVFGLTTLELG